MPIATFYTYTTYCIDFFAGPGVFPCRYLNAAVNEKKFALIYCPSYCPSKYLVLARWVDNQSNEKHSLATWSMRFFLILVLAPSAQ